LRRSDHLVFLAAVGDLAATLVMQDRQQLGHRIVTAGRPVLADLAGRARLHDTEMPTAQHRQQRRSQTTGRRPHRFKMEIRAFGPEERDHPVGIRRNKILQGPVRVQSIHARWFKISTRFHQLAEPTAVHQGELMSRA
jgi:hypothetical protein